MKIYQVRLYQYGDLMIDELFTTYELALEYANKLVSDRDSLDCQEELNMIKSKQNWKETEIARVMYLATVKLLDDDFTAIELISEREVK